jgi:hypothetical protein
MEFGWEDDAQGSGGSRRARCQRQGNVLTSRTGIMGTGMFVTIDIVVCRLVLDDWKYLEELQGTGDGESTRHLLVFIPFLHPHGPCVVVWSLGRCNLEPASY